MFLYETLPVGLSACEVPARIIVKYQYYIEFKQIEMHC